MAKQLIENDLYTDDANKLSIEVERLLKPLMEEWVEKGYEIHEISHIISGDLHMLEARIRIERRIAAWREEKERRKK